MAIKYEGPKVREGRGMHLAPVTVAKCKVRVELPESEQYNICSSTFIHPIASDLWR